MTVFYCHTGNPYYLKYSIAQTLSVMPSSRLVLLGDDTNVLAIPGFEHHHQSLFVDGIDAFRTAYRHFSPNDFDFELTCFLRWFHVASFVKKNAIQGPILYLDSDVLLYRDVFQDPEFDGAQMAVTRELGPAFTYFSDAQALQGLTDFIQDMYSRPEKIAVLQSIWETGKSPFWMQGKYVSDMQVLGLYVRTLRKTVDLASFRPSLVFDYAFHTSEGFLFNPYKRIKRIWWEGNNPYGIRDEKKIEFAGLHFQVGTKIFIPAYYRGHLVFQDSARFWFVHIRGSFTTALKWLLDGFGKSWRIHARNTRSPR